MRQAEGTSMTDKCGLIPAEASVYCAELGNKDLDEKGRKRKALINCTHRLTQHFSDRDSVLISLSF